MISVRDKVDIVTLEGAGGGTKEWYKTLTKEVVDHLAQVVPGEDILVVVPIRGTGL